MTDQDYREILRSTREMLRESGFSGADERIMSDLRGSDGPFWDLTFYLKHLTEEIALGSDDQLSGVLRRVRTNVQTESGETIQGVRVYMVGEDRKRYETDHIDFAPDPQLDEIASELRALLEELYDDYHRGSD